MGAIDQVGAKNVVLGGLSQGCAAALIALLTWGGEPIAAGCGMCEWLPFRMPIEDIASSDSFEDNKDGVDDDLFDVSGERAERDAPTQAIAFLCEEIELAAKEPSLSFQRIPIFLGHAVEDEKVPIGLGCEAVSCLKQIRASVEWREYESLGHWYSGTMLSQLVDTLRNMAGWGDTQRASYDLDTESVTSDMEDVVI
ncbi:MAG: hypothetical protein Q9170_004845 [Blastenia crenularia]